MEEKMEEKQQEEEEEEREKRGGSSSSWVCFLTHIFGAVRVWLTPGASISLGQLVRTDVFQQNLSPVTCSSLITHTPVQYCTAGHHVNYLHKYWC